jgi:hypothetical protein
MKKSFDSTVFGMTGVENKFDILKFTDDLSSKVNLADYTDAVEEIVLVSIVMPEDLLQFYPEKRRYKPKKKSISLCIHFDLTYFLTASPEDCQKVIVETFVKELKNIKNAWGMKNIKFDGERFYKKIMEVVDEK